MRWTLLFLCARLVLGQGTEPKPKPEEYEAHGLAKKVPIGAEFMIHSVSGRGRTFIVQDYLVVEVALYPPKGETLNVAWGAFSLRLNGKKQLMAVAPSMVAASLLHPEWKTGPQLEAGAGAGNVGVILGRPVPSEIPGDQRPRTPLPPRAPEPDNPSGMESEPPVRAEELVGVTAFPGGEVKRPVSGFLYFPYKGKSRSIKTLELLYQDTVIRLR